MSARKADVAVIGAGIVGIACAYYLARSRPALRIVIVDQNSPMSLTSAASGENYRNWWPHPIMTAFTDYSIDLLEEIARRHDNRVRITRRGYALATRQPKPDQLLEELHTGYGPAGASRIRVHGAASSSSYTPAVSEDWQDAPEGVDVIQNQELIRRHFPTFDTEVSTILHVRRAGDISGQQLGSLMLEEIRAAGGTVSLARVTEIVRQDGGFALKMRSEEGEQTLDAEILVNAAGPYVADIAQMLGEALPVENVFHQKIAFADNLGAVDRQMPFSIDLDAQAIDWTSQERQLLAEDHATAWLARLRRPRVSGPRSPDGSQLSGYRSERREQAEPALEAVLRSAAAANYALRRLLYHDKRELAVDWAHEDRRGLRRRRAFRFRNDGGLCNGSALRQLRSRRNAARVCRASEPVTLRRREFHAAAAG